MAKSITPKQYRAAKKRIAANIDYKDRKYKRVKLSNRSFGPKLKDEIIKHIPGATFYVKKHVSGIGYTYFIYSLLGRHIGMWHKDRLTGSLLHVRTN